METRTLNPRTRTERRAEPPTYRQQVQRAINPATFEIIGTVPMTPEAMLPTLVARAREAFGTWSALSHRERAVPLQALRTLIAQQSGRIAEVIAKSVGKPLVEAYQHDVAGVVELLDEYLAHAGEFLADQALPVAPRLSLHKKAIIRFAPRGVVCVIAPWSQPFELVMKPAIAALAAGNAVLMKPTSSAPMVGDLIDGLFQDAFRDFPGLAQVVQGPGRIGSVLATAEGVSFVVFSGSTAVGRRLQQELAPLLRPALLDLGGCDPMIVCDDANLERAANAAVYGRFCNNGQNGSAVKRVYVHEAVVRPFVERVLAHVRALKLGPYTDPAVDVGPLANDRGIGNLRSLLHDAVDKGAKLEIGGFPAIQSGWYWPPTVLTGMDHSMRIMKEEAFGPILPIQTVVNDEEAIQMANDNEYGLDAYVFSSDPLRARKLADALEAGAVAINEVIVNYVIRDLPFGGIKQSGLNPYGGRRGLQLFVQPKGMVIDDGRNDAEPHWFPYGEDQLEAARQQFMP